MSILDMFRPGSIGEEYDAREALEQRAVRAETTNDVLREELSLHESMTRLELALEDEGWNRLHRQHDLEFTRDGLRRIAALSAVMWRKNPLIRRAVNVRSYYTWAQGVTVKAADDTVNQLIQDTMDDRWNRRVLFGPRARRVQDRQLSLDGNLFLTLHAHPQSGRLQIRQLWFTEIDDTIRNPNDRGQTWFYVRRWTDRDGVQTALYPDLDHHPTTKPATYNGGGRYDGTRIMWDTPVLHVSVDGLAADRFGTPEPYAALDWALAYKMFLEDWASYVKALARFAWRHKTTSARAAAVKTAHGTGRDRSDGTVRPAGATAITTGDDALEPVKQSGAHVDAESGRPLALMVASAMDVPYAILTGDADNSNLATAKALDRPFELALQDRRQLWTDVYDAILHHAIRKSIDAPRGILAGTVDRDEFGQPVVTSNVDMTVDVDWPPLVEHDLKDLVEAYKWAVETGTVPDETMARLILTAFGVDNVDELIAEMQRQAARAESEEEAERRAVEAVADVVEALRHQIPS